MDLSIVIGRQPAPTLKIQLLGTLSICRDGSDLALPPSRKVRGLLAYLALATKPVARAGLCELLWDAPNDPKGELRWSLSKLRVLIDDADRHRVHTAADLVSVDLSGCTVDAIDVARNVANLAELSVDDVRSLESSFCGDFLDGLQIEADAFNAWLGAQRRRFRALHAAVLEELVRRTADGASLEYLEKWLLLSPFDPHVHELFLASLARNGKVREGDEHVAATAKRFATEGVDGLSIKNFWSAAKGCGGKLPSAAASDFGTASAPPAEEPRIDAGRRVSIAVMPFLELSMSGRIPGGAADALAHDVITRLAKSRSLFVIAQGTMFALHEKKVGHKEAAKMLNVDYVASGTLLRSGAKFIVTVELIETTTNRIIWADRYESSGDEAFEVLDEIGDRIVASISLEIETSERNRALLRPPNSLNAWEAHHRGLWHAYRFTKADNQLAFEFFRRAVELDRTFARAYAGLSFTHFQNAFQGWTERAPEVEFALKTAGQAVMADERDPAARLAMGRSLWLMGRYDQTIDELEQAVSLSPSFSMGHYMLGFVQAQLGDPDKGIAALQHSQHLSPFDPMLFAMFGSRAMALVRLGRYDEAADNGVRAASRPNAHEHIYGIAALSLGLCGRVMEAQAHLTKIQATRSDYEVNDFLSAFHFTLEDQQTFRRAATLIGMRH